MHPQQNTRHAPNISHTRQRENFVLAIMFGIVPRVYHQYNPIQNMNYEIITFTANGDSTGSLIAVETGREIPFAVKRVYYIYNTAPDALRGRHAHSRLEQLIFCPSGSCDFILDDGFQRETVKMDSPSKGLYIKGNIWREFTNFSPDCVVMVLASEFYDDDDYIKNYQEFLQKVRQ